jgi:hypothetical protein
MEKAAAKATFAGIALALATAALLLAHRGAVERQSFKAFYCAGAAVKDRQNPYLVEPLRSCERRVAPSALPAGYVEPAPLPGYALIPFAALAMLPPKPAAEVFVLALVIAVVLAAYALAEVLPVARAGLLLAFAPLALLNVAYGEIAPIALAGICTAAYAISRRQWTAAGLAVCVALIQPNVGLPAVAAVFLFAPRSRLSIALTAATLAILSVIAVGLDRNLEYLTTVLPLMANAELVASDQYNLSHLLYAAGASSALATLLGKIWFAVAASCGVLVAGMFATRLHRPTLLPLLPPAFALLFGIYVHDIQILLALPAALAIAVQLRGRAFRTIAVIAVAILIAVWTQRIARTALVLDAAGVAGGIYAVLDGPVRRRVGGSILAALATVAGVLLLQHAQPPVATAQILTGAFHVAATDWAPTAWAAYLRATPALMASGFWLKIPTWLGLAVVTLGALVVCAQSAMPSRSGSRALRLASAQYSVFSRRYD